MTTEMTRERFEKYAEAFDLPTYLATNGLYLEDVTQSAWSAWQAAKADELAFLERVHTELFDAEWEPTYNLVRNRIAELKKGESRG